MCVPCYYDHVSFLILEISSCSGKLAEKHQRTGMTHFPTTIAEAREWHIGQDVETGHKEHYDNCFVAAIIL